MKTLIIPVLLILIIPTALAAAIHGTVYNTEFAPINGIILEIDTAPPQQLLAKDGTYAFTINPGKYTLTAKKDSQILITRDIEIIEDGTFTMDLFQDIDFDDEILEDAEFDIEDLAENSAVSPIIYTVAVILTIIILIFIWKSGKKQGTQPEEEKPAIADTSKILEILKKHDGRITQKELRKLLPLSEAKISLMITELEHKNQIEKIKKGRTNIIILKLP